jgi:hypothetical protein
MPVCIYYSNNVEQQFQTVASSRCSGRNRTVAKLAVWVVNIPERAIWVQFEGSLPTCLNWTGYQRVFQWVHL